MFVVGESFRYGLLRSLQATDIQGMLEWMADPAIAGVFQADFQSMNENSALEFIRSSWDDESSLHFAIAGKNDTYMGTISLQRVDYVNSAAEYAVSTRACAHGTGIAMNASYDLLRFAFRELGFHRVYLNVRASNKRAIRFYEKVGFIQEGIARQSFKCKNDGYEDLLWFSMLETEFK